MTYLITESNKISFALERIFFIFAKNSEAPGELDSRAMPKKNTTKEVPKTTGAKEEISVVFKRPPKGHRQRGAGTVIVGKPAQVNGHLSPKLNCTCSEFFPHWKKMFSISFKPTIS